MSALLPADLERFGKFLGLLGSDHDGERAAAARKATDFLHARKLGWPDVTDMLKRPPVVIPKPPESDARRYQTEPVRPHQQFARRCLGSKLIAWKPHERRFLEQMAEQMRRPSEAQSDWLDGLVDRLARKAREGSDVDF